MLREGQLVVTLTAKIGQAPRTGRIRRVHDGFVDVEWEDGHTSTITRESVQPAHKEAQPEKAGRH
jgi:hypothetical protein